MKKREAGLDLFRCLGLLFVTGLHGFLYNGFYGQIQGMPMLAANTFRWLFSGCNGMFMLMTGYLKTTKPLDRQYFSGLKTVLIGYFLTCAFSYPLRYWLLGEHDSIQVWVNRLFTFEGYGWYIGMYIGLVLLSPMVNLSLDQLSKPGQLSLAGVMLLLTALPSMTPLHLLPEYWTGIYPMTYYMLGAVIRRLKPQLSCWIGLLGAVATAFVMGLLSSLTASGGVFTDGFPQGGNGGFLTTVMVTLLFLGTYRLPVSSRAGRLLAWLSSGVFEGYLLSRLLDVWIYDLFPFWHRPKCYLLLFLVVTIPVFFVSIVAGKIVHALALSLSKPHTP